MAANLDTLIERAREWRNTHPMTEAERDAQAKSFAYGNCKLSNEEITLAHVERAYEKLLAERDEKLAQLIVEAQAEDMGYRKGER